MCIVTVRNGLHNINNILTIFNGVYTNVKKKKKTSCSAQYLNLSYVVYAN